MGATGEDDVQDGTHMGRRMRTGGALLLLAAAPTLLAGQVRSSGGYVVRQGDREIARERYEFDGSILTSTLAVPAQSLVIGGRTVYDGNLSPTEYVATATLGADTVPFQTLSVAFADFARWEVTGGGDQSGSTPLARPYSVLRNLSFAHLAVLLLRYDRRAGGRQEFHLWIPRGAVVVPLGVQLSGNAGTLDLRGTPINVQLAESGWATRFDIPAQGVVAEWAGEVDIETVAVAEPERVPPAGVGEETFTFASGDLQIEGTLAVPLAARAPVRLGIIVAGSGATDRDGNSGGALRSDMYLQLAWRLAERGIATLRYDKRGLGSTAGAFDPATVTLGDFAGDLRAAAEAAQADGRFSDVVILGHSEGASLASIAANGGAPVRAIALLAGMGRPFLDVLRGQLAEQLDEETMAAFDAAMPRYLAGEDPGEVPSELQVFFAPVNQRFMQSAVAFDPAAELARVSVPVLIVQGETDFQIGVEDAELLHTAKPDAELVIIPAANHVFKHAPSRDRAAQAAQYSDPSLPIVAQLVDAIVEWVEALP
ncbi:MAG: alpha/beta hydrolase [Gemmatimonadota bacterium]|nr:MAG: alpha/beta hydrolase [Gemmatimonadota bacterium]